MGRLNKGLCDRFKQVRINNNFTQVTYGEKLGIRQGDVSNIEKYRIEPSKNVLISIIELFNISGHWLLTGEGEIYKKTGNHIAEKPAPYGDNTVLIAENKRLASENERLKKFILRIATKEELD